MAENFVPNISFESVNEEFNRSYDTKENSKGTAYDPKNYLDTFLADGETSKTITIRILPSSSTNFNPFTHVHFHSFKLSAKQAQDMKVDNPFKSFVCLNRSYNPDIDAELGDGCPFCNRAKELYKESEKAGLTKNEVDEIRKEASKFLHIDNVIIRCIVRGKENEGVKFWKIKVRRDASDPFNKILNLVKQRNAESMAVTGKEKNILDLYNGRDFLLTITNKAKGVNIDVSDVSIDQPLSKDNEQILKWVNDEKKWTDVYGCKPADYLQLIIDGKTPWFDKYEEKKWVDSDIIKNRIEEHKQKAQDDIDEAESKIIVKATEIKPSQVKAAEPINVMYNGEDDDLPF